MPFGPDCEFADQAACERANQDRDDPAAYCAALRRRTEGHCMDSRDAGVTLPVLVLERPRLRLARPLARQAKSWYRISAKAAADPGEGDGEGQDGPKVEGDTTIIDIYDEIGWFGTGAAEFVADLRKVATPNIELHLNSPGGDVFDGVAIYNALRQHKAYVHVVVDSLAASAASFIAMAGERITAMANAMLMIHDPWGLVIGNATDMTEMATLLDKHGDNIASIYAARAGGKVADWRSRMLAETWYLADEAYAAGLVDEVDQSDGRPIEDAWDLSVFAHRPEQARPAASAATDGDPVTEGPAAEDPAAGAVPDDGAATQAPESGNGRRPVRMGTTPSWFVPSPPGKETPQWQMP